FFSSRRRHTRSKRDWSSDVCSSDLLGLESDLILATLFAGVFLGTGLGVIFRYGGTTGGVDIIARIINKHFGFSMGRIMFTIDFCVITLSLFTYLELVEGM